MQEDGAGTEHELVNQLQAELQGLLAENKRLKASAAAEVSGSTAAAVKVSGNTASAAAVSGKTASASKVNGITAAAGSAENTGEIYRTAPAVCKSAFYLYLLSLSML